MSVIVWDGFSLAVDNDAAARRAYSSLGIPTKSKVSLATEKGFWSGVIK